MLCTLCILLLIACIYDYSQKRIPNWLNILIFALGSVFRILYFGFGDYIGVCMQVAIFAVIFFNFFRLGGIGAGDIKLFCACMPYMSLRNFLYFLFISMLISALISIFKVIKIIKINGTYVPESLKVCLAGPIFAGALILAGGVI